MTVSNTNNIMRYNANGSTTVFAYSFKIFAQTDLIVKKVLISTGAETLLVLTTDYTVSGVGVDGGGNVTLLVAPSSLYHVVIQRVLPLTQATDYVENDPFPAEVHETVADRAVMICQQLQEVVDRCVKVGSSNSGIGVELPIPEAGTNLGWNDAGTGLENRTPDDSAAAASATAAAVSAANAAASQAAAAASAAGINLPSMVGQASKLLQVKSDESGYQFISSIVDTLLAAISTAGKVLGSAITSLTSVPAGAGLLPPINGGVPSGVWLPYGGSAAPSGYLLCDGSAISRTTYADLFTAIGTAFGVGNGTTTFNIPDMRDSFPLGKGTTHSALNSPSGADTVTLGKGNIPAHVHVVSTNVSASSFGSVAIANSNQSVDTSRSTGDGTADGLKTSPDAVSILNKNIVCNYIIKT